MFKNIPFAYYNNTKYHPKYLNVLVRYYDIM